MLSTMEDVTARLVQFVRTAFGSRVDSPDQLGPASPLFSNQLVDSMGVIELLAFIEREFRVSLTVTMDELAKLDTAANLAQRITQAQRPAAP